MNEESAAQSKKEDADAALKDAQSEKNEAARNRVVQKPRKNMMTQLYKNGELTQADVDQANTNAEKEAENAVKEQKRQVESAQKAADAAKQALETAKQEFDNLGGAQALQDAESKKTTAQKNVEQAEKDKDQTQKNLEAAQKELENVQNQLNSAQKALQTSTAAQTAADNELKRCAGSESLRRDVAEGYR